MKIFGISIWRGSKYKPRTIAEAVTEKQLLPKKYRSYYHYLHRPLKERIAARDAILDDTRLRLTAWKRYS